MEREYEVIVIGGGHAGVEAALASARRGAETLLVTHDRHMIGAMSCNPAIGGIGKGHIVREVDAMGGSLAKAADDAAIHYRMLNRSKGKAVWGPRIQADRTLFRQAVQLQVRQQPNLRVIEGSVDRLLLACGRVVGVDLAGGDCLRTRSVILAAGTFLGGKLFHGREASAGGRIGDAAISTLSQQLRDVSRVARLKTGTPPRLDGRTIDWAKLARQESDADLWTMSPYRIHRANPQVPCGVTRTSVRAHEIIAEAADQSPLYSGDIEGHGPRYCPSIEDKIRRFDDRDSHQIYLEPEGLDDPTIYPNGISTSLPAAVQNAFVREIPGLENVKITEPGYAVEYDFLDPRQLNMRLEHRDIPGLFLAGQVNGTTGYEEAAGQGLVAGLNAAASSCDLEPFIADRRECYLGVMIDDLTLQGVTEPYRMLTARAERRLHLRADNAEARLFATAANLGTLSPAMLAEGAVREDQRRGLHDDACGLSSFDTAIIDDELAETARYAPYIAREDAQHRRRQALKCRPIDARLDYRSVAGLSTEMLERLIAAKPETLGAAMRISGITPAAIDAILAAGQTGA